MKNQNTIKAFIDLGDDKFVPVEDIKKDFDKRQLALRNLKEQRADISAELALVNSTIRFIESNTLNLTD